MLRSQLDDATSDAERQMDSLRHFKHAQTMRLIAQDLAGTLPLETLSDHLSDLACVILAEVQRIAWQGLRQRHRPEPRFAIIGYGKLGGKELGYASDLDLVFLYDPPRSRGEIRAAGAAHQSLVISIIPPGALRDRLRLRRTARADLLVSPFAGYATTTTAGLVWNIRLSRPHQRGDAAIGREFEAMRVAICAERDLAQLRR